MWGQALLTSTHTDTLGVMALLESQKLNFFRAGKRRKAEGLLFTSSPKSGFAACACSLIPMSQGKRGWQVGTADKVPGKAAALKTDIKAEEA